MINARFHRSPYLPSLWTSDGILPDVGVLLHCFDAYEKIDEPWKPRNEMLDTGLSASFIFAGQRHSATVGLIPLFTPCLSGVIFRPGATRILCGNGGDAGGHCSFPGCSSPRFLPLDQQSAPDQNYPGDGCSSQSWSPADCGPFLRRVTSFQKAAKRSFYNEVCAPPRD